MTTEGLVSPIPPVFALREPSGLGVARQYGGTCFALLHLLMAGCGVEHVPEHCSLNCCTILRTTVLATRDVKS
jgi:hypothetical protein